MSPERMQEKEWKACLAHRRFIRCVYIQSQENFVFAPKSTGMRGIERMNAMYKMSQGGTVEVAREV